MCELIGKTSFKKKKNVILAVTSLLRKTDLTEIDYFWCSVFLN